MIFYCWLNHMVIFLCLIHPHPFVLLSSPFSPVPLFLALCVLLLFGWFYFGRVARRPPSSTVDGGVLSRLLTPTQASLARSKSAATLSADGKDAPGNLGVEEPDREERYPKKKLFKGFHICNVVSLLRTQLHQAELCCRPSSLWKHNLNKTELEKLACQVNKKALAVCFAYYSLCLFAPKPGHVRGDSSTVNIQAHAHRSGSHALPASTQSEVVCWAE